MALPQDTFTEASDTNLQSHTADTGETWTKFNGVANVVVKGGLGIAQATNTGDFLRYYMNYTHPSPNYAVRARIRSNSISSGDARIFVGLRFDSTKSLEQRTFYYAMINYVAQQIEVGKLVNGVGTVLDTVAQSVSANTYNFLKLEANNNVLNTYWAGNLISTVNDSSITVAGKPALAFSAGSSNIIDATAFVVLGQTEITVADTGTISESVSHSVKISLADTATGQDIIAFLGVAFTISDIITLLDLILKSGSSDEIILIGDQGSITETLNFPSKVITISESGMILDLASRLIAIVESIAASEGLTIQVNIPLTDVATLIESLSVNGTLTLFDTINLLETIGAIMGIQDIATILESIIKAKSGTLGELARAGDGILVKKKSVATFVAPEELFYARPRNRFFTIQNARKIG